MSSLTPRLSSFSLNDKLPTYYPYPYVFPQYYIPYQAQASPGQSGAHAAQTPAQLPHASAHPAQSPVHSAPSAQPAHHLSPASSVQSAHSQPALSGHSLPEKKHRKRRSMVLKFPSSIETPVSFTSQESKINFPIQKLPTTPTDSDMPLDKLLQLKNAIYPNIDIKKYLTLAIDPLRNYLVVFEYQVNGHWVIWDYETGFVHLTGIWKATLNDEHSMEESLLPKSNSKADIVKLLESTPKEYQQYIKRIRGGFLKIQGTWLPYNLCKMLARRFCYHIRYELVPIFGVDFPQYCLTPADAGFGELKLDEAMGAGPAATGSAVGAAAASLSPAGPGAPTTPKKKRMPIINTNISTFASPQSGSGSSVSAGSSGWGHSKSLSVDSAMKVHKKKRSNLTNLAYLPSPYSAGSVSGGAGPSPYGAFAAGPLAQAPPMMPLPAPPVVLDSVHAPAHFSHRKTLSAPMAPISYDDMVEIVNASRCLQSIRLRSRLNSILKSIHKSTLTKSLSDTLPISHDSVPSGANYVMRAPAYHIPSVHSVHPVDLSPARPVQPTHADDTGILSILVAAGMADRPSPKKPMRINDLLS